MAEINFSKINFKILLFGHFGVRIREVLLYIMSVFFRKRLFALAWVWCRNISGDHTKICFFFPGLLPFLLFSASSRISFLIFFFYSFSFSVLFLRLFLFLVLLLFFLLYQSSLLFSFSCPSSIPSVSSSSSFPPSTHNDASFYQSQAYLVRANVLQAIDKDKESLEELYHSILCDAGKLFFEK